MFFFHLLQNVPYGKYYIHQNRLNYSGSMFESESESSDTWTPNTFLEVPENNFSKGSRVQFPQVHAFCQISQHEQSPE